MKDRQRHQMAPSNFTQTDLEISPDIFNISTIKKKKRLHPLCHLLPGSAGGVRGIGGSSLDPPDWHGWEGKLKPLCLPGRSQAPRVM